MDRLVASKASVIQHLQRRRRELRTIDIDDLNNKRKVERQQGLRRRQLANVLFTKELQRRYGQQGIASACFHPGNVATGFASDTSSWMRHIVRNALGRRLMMTTPDKGGETPTWLAEGTPGQTCSLPSTTRRSRRPRQTSSTPRRTTPTSPKSCGSVATTRSPPRDD